MHESEIGLGHEIGPTATTHSAMGAGGACSRHGVYNGRFCPGCNEETKDRAKTHALAQFRQSVWEVAQWLTTAEAVEYFNGVLDEIETDEP